MLYCLVDNRARTSTELAAVADVGTSTASAHLDRMLRARLLTVQAQGRHRYYCLAGPEVGRVLEALSAMAGSVSPGFIPSAPSRLREARTCYDHVAGILGVQLHDRLLAMDWISAAPGGDYAITVKGRGAFAGMGIATDGLADSRRRVAFGCLDWSERRFHIGGSLGAAILGLVLTRKWVSRELDGRALTPTSLGRREFARQFGVTFPPAGRQGGSS